MSICLQSEIQKSQKDRWLKVTWNAIHKINPREKTVGGKKPRSSETRDFQKNLGSWGPFAVSEDTTSPPASECPQIHLKIKLYIFQDVILPPLLFIFALQNRSWFSYIFHSQ